MKKVIIFLLTCILLNTNYAQRVWYFGQGAGIKFNNNPSILPSAFGTNGTNPIQTYEGCALVHDNIGNVIISTEGKTVYNKNNVAMPNGTGLFGHESATQSAIIVPVPGCCSGKKYFIFTVGSWSNKETELNAKGFYYSIVDLTLNGGLGDVVAKNIPLITPTTTEVIRKGFVTEKLTAIQDGNNGYWVLAHGNKTATLSNNGKRFYALHITPQSIGDCDNPIVDTLLTTGNFVTTDIGEEYGKAASPAGNGMVGQMKFSPTGTKVALAERTSGKTVLLDFNLTSGILTNERNIKITNDINYGVEFSKNEKYIYTTFTEFTSANIYQTEVGNFDLIHSILVADEVDGPGSLQLAKDNNIYVSKKNNYKIGVIQNANLSSANYFNNITLPNNTYSSFSLPTMLLHTYCTPCDTSTTTLLTTKTDATSGLSNGTINIVVFGGSAPYTHSWNNGANTSSLTGLSVGNYMDTITDRNGCIKIEEISIISTPCSQCSIQSTLTKPNNGGNLTLSSTNTQLECGKGYDFNPPTLTCNPANSAMLIKQIKIIDGLGNTPSWASSFTGTGMLNIPANTIGLFYVKYVWGTPNNRCDSVSYSIDITCPPTCPKCTIATGLYLNSSWVNLSTTTTTTIKCNQTIPMSGAMTCSIPSTGITTIHSLVDSLGNTPSWVNTAQLNINQLIIPTGINGTFYIKKVWSKNGSKCDSISYPINITCQPCPTCTGSVTYEDALGVHNFSTSANGLTCGKTYELSADNFKCTIPFSPTDFLPIVRNSSGISMPWIIGGDDLNIPPNTQGSYTFITKWKNPATGLYCDSVIYPLQITCLPPCNLTAKAGPDKLICPLQSTTIGTAATSGNTYSWSSNPAGFSSTLANPSVSPSVATTYFLTVTNTATQCVAKDTVVVSINNNCNPPPCTPCTTKVAATSTVSLTNNTNLGASNLVQSFSFTGLPANITEVRATVTNVKLFAVDENGKIKEECLSCKNEARTWASIINGSGIAGLIPKININGVETAVPVTLAPDINARNIVWKNTGAFSVNNPVELSFLLPQKSTLPCCTRKATICVKFVFRNDKCEECIATKCFDVEIK